MYIKFMTEENKNIYISTWLLLITILVALIIIVGGLTRLTDSGLSITRWGLISGILPPFTNSEWEKTFSLYKKIPEYQLQNFSMTLNEFKVIFWWEFSHRMLGRILGIFYIIPLIFFTFKFKISKKLIISFYLIFILILIQGFIGWYMVSSGLDDAIDVSHYRLSLHLTLAFIIFILLLWNFIKYTDKEKYIIQKRLSLFLPNIFFLLLIIQISVGALVSGLDGGQIYQSWPLMNGNYFPDDSFFSDLFSKESLSTPSLVQFLHRSIAYIIFFLFLVIFLFIFKKEEYSYLRKSTLIVSFFLLLQIFLGILTILSGAQILIASMHQIGSILLITSTLILVFKNSKIN